MATLIQDDNDDKKRKQEEDSSNNGSASQQPKALKTLNEYAGYSFQKESEPKIDTVQKPLSGKEFFEHYIAPRKPCVLDYLPTLNQDGNQPIEITRALLEQVAGDKTIQVERRPDKKANFGQNRTEERQVLLTINELLQKLFDGGDDDGELYYWSTQEDTEDPYNVPCRQLVDSEKIPAKLDWAGNLILSSCNLWMGQAKEGASSGLHHDYHDNFYCLLKGRKRFRLLSPDCAPQLATYGTIDRIHPNGRVSYVGNEARADGVPLESLEEEEEIMGENDNEDEEEEEEVVLGHGFDYVSDSEEEIDETKDDFEEIMLDENGKEVGKITRPLPANAGMTDDHPDSFSRINPCLNDQKALEKEFPGYASCKQVMVDLKAGQVLFLPAGWFHEVTSYSTAEDEEEKKSESSDTSLDGCHMALNYWYHPPDALENYDSPYTHNFWKLEEQQRLIEKQQKSRKE